MTHPDHDPSSLGDYIQQFGERYSDAMDRPEAAASPTTTRRPHLRRFAPALGLGSIAASAAIIYALVALPVGDKIDVVQKASAALGDSGDILHYVARSIPDPNQKLPAGCTQDDLRNDTTEVWQTTSGTAHWREVMTMPTTVACLQTGPDGRPLTGKLEQAYHGNVHTFLLGDLRLFTTDRVKGESPTGATLLGSTPGADSRDFVVALRDMLRSGKMHVVGGPHSDRGHTALTLESRSFVHHPERRRSEGSLDVTSVTTYVVDAKTFKPLRLTTNETYVHDKGPYKGASHVLFGEEFTVYERLPKTPENEALLDIHPAGPTRTSIPDSEKTPQQRLQDRQIAEYNKKHPVKDR